MTIYFISDLHLSPAHPEIRDAFYKMLSEKFSEATALYILGDFFDAWIGDDEDDPFYSNIVKTLKSYADNGLTIYFMHGNRDFLVKDTFCRAAGVTLLQDPCVIELNGQAVLLMHGDSLCTADHEYMAFRAQVRSEQWQSQILSLPLEQRRVMAAQLREQSKSMNSNKADDIMDVNPEDVESAFREYRVKTLIHGHTHRPACHDLCVDDKQCQRIVLGDWHQQGWYLKAEQDSLELLNFDIH